jgi:hypothetical protein
MLTSSKKKYFAFNYDGVLLILLLILTPYSRRRPPGMAEGRTMQEQLSKGGSGAFRSTAPATGAVRALRQIGLEPNLNSVSWPAKQVSNRGCCE